MRRHLFAAALIGIAASGCQPADPAGDILRASADAIREVENGTYAYTYRGSGSAAGEYSGRVSFRNAPDGRFFFKAELAPSPTAGRDAAADPPTFTIASNGRQLTARDEATARFHFGSYAGGAGHLAAPSGYAVLFEFSLDTPYEAELQGSPEHLGRETVDGVDCEVVRAHDPRFGGGEVTWYIGVEDGLPRGRDWVASGTASESRYAFRLSSLEVNTTLRPDALGAASDFDDELVDEDALSLDPGAPAPDWSLTTAAGDAVSLSDLRGRVVVLDFWTTWCAACRDLMPAIDRVVQTFDGDSVRLFGLSAWDDPDAAPVEEGAARGLSHVMLGRAEAAAIDYRVVAPPAVFVIGRYGTIAFARNPVESAPDRLAADLQAAIETALSGPDGG